ncbi:MAG: hypothetical protein IJU90_05710 [Bacteroidales bacterium]|nr:hypothetical protein [Bacteroidales bacterium]
MAKKNNKIVYLHLHQPLDGKMDFYYASLADMYEAMHPNTIGVARQSLYNAGFVDRGFYANKFCTIELITLE